MTDPSGQEESFASRPTDSSNTHLATHLLDIVTGVLKGPFRPGRREDHGDSDRD